MAIDYKPEQNDYKNLTPFKAWLMNQINTWGVNNFPFLEEDFDKLTNYGMMMKLMKAVNDVINNENLVEDDMNKLYQAFTELQNYINNYFDNLDVQEEINAKLDEMVEQGTLQEIIAEYLNSKAVFGFDTVSDMLSATNLIDGSYAETLGYYEINDGGGATYKIVDDDTLDVDNLFVLELNNGLKAQIIVEDGTLNVLQFGAKNDNSTDLTELFNSLISSDYNRLFLPQGQYKILGIVEMKSNLFIDGAGTTSQINIQETGRLRTLPDSDQFRNINLTNLCIRVNGTRTNYAVDFNNADLCKIERCLIRSDNGVQSYNGICFRLNGGDHCFDNKVINNQFNKASLHFIHSTDNFIVNNMLWADEMTETGGLVLEGNCSNTLIQGNHFGGHPTLGQLRIISSITQLRILGNYFDAQGIGISAVDLEQCDISDNIFYHVAQAININNLKLCILNNNTFRDCDINDEGYPDVKINTLQGGNVFNSNIHVKTANVTHTIKTVPYDIPDGDSNYPHSIVNSAILRLTNLYQSTDTTQYSRTHFINCYPASLFTA